MMVICKRLYIALQVVTLLPHIVVHMGVCINDILNLLPCGAQNGFI
jgi:hypothetical protein